MSSLASAIESGLQAPLAELVAASSLELAPRELHRAGDMAALLPADACVYIPSLPGLPLTLNDPFPSFFPFPLPDSALAILICTLAFTLLYPALVQIVAKDPNGVELRSIFLGYAGLFLLGAAYMALGLFISSLTESQVVAALITFVVLLMTWIIGWTSAETEGATRELVTYLSSVSHLDSFSKGTVDLKDVVYFLSICALGLFATHRAVEAHRWS